MQVEETLPSDSKLLSSCDFNLWGDEPLVVTTNARSMFLWAGSEAQRFNLDPFFGARRLFTSLWDAERCTLFSRPFWTSTSSSVDSDSDSLSDMSLLSCGRVRLPYFFEPITNFGDTSRLGDLCFLRDVFVGVWDGESPAMDEIFKYYIFGK